MQLWGATLNKIPYLRALYLTTHFFIVDSDVCIEKIYLLLQFLKDPQFVIC